MKVETSRTSQNPGNECGQSLLIKYSDRVGVPRDETGAEENAGGRNDNFL